MSEPLVTFRGPVKVLGASGALGLTLAGVAGEGAGEATALAFTGAGAVSLPDALTDLAVVTAGAARYRLAGPAGEWQVEATAVHLHHDVSAEFYRVLPPRPVPFTKRCLWAVVLTLAKSRAGLGLLAALRR
ncbi:MAG TPA: hypothetical protein VIE42_06020 [Steroidobacteraceae bacterium]